MKQFSDEDIRYLKKFKNYKVMTFIGVALFLLAIVLVFELMSLKGGLKPSEERDTFLLYSFFIFNSFWCGLLFLKTGVMGSRFYKRFSKYMDNPNENN